MIVTDGVFSMDGTIAQLDGICDLAQRHDALVVVDDSHATGFMGKTGRGTHEHHDVIERAQPGVERGDRRSDDRPRPRHAEHVVQVNHGQRRLANEQRQPPSFVR